MLISEFSNENGTKISFKMYSEEINNTIQPKISENKQMSI